MPACAGMTALCKVPFLENGNLSWIGVGTNIT